MIYSVELDRVVVNGSTVYGGINGHMVELFNKSEDEKDSEMISAGYIRVSHPNLDGFETKWAEIWEINESRRLAGLVPINQEQIAE